MAENEPRLNYSQPVEFPFGTTSQQQPVDHRLQQQNPELQLHQVLLPKTVVLRRQDGHGFGFTLRHFIVYPPESCNDSNGLGPRQANPTALTIAQPMDTVFVKEVRTQGPAHLAGLRTGDRLLAVNGMPVAGTPYARVVAAIQQTPATLTLQVVPKECDILQTFFSETAHNPETNQRQHKLHSQMLVAGNIEQPSTSTGAMQSHPSLKHGKHDLRQKQHPQTHHNIAHQQQQQLHQRLLPPQQFNTNIEPFYSNLKNDRIDNDNTSDRIYAEPYSSFEHRNVKAEPQAPMQVKRRGDDMMQLFTRDNHNQQNVGRNSNESNRSILTFDSHFAHLNSDAFNDRRESSSSISSSIDSYGSGSTLTSDLGDSAIMTRLRKSFEQKEEFLRRPSQPTGYKSDNLATNESTVRQREFYARPNRLQKSIWPPQEMSNKNIQSQNENRLVESDNESMPSSTTQQVYYIENKSPPPLMTMSNQNDVAMPLQQKSYNIMSSEQAAKTAAAVKLAKHIAREQFYNGLQQQQQQQQNKQMVAQAAYDKERNDIPSIIMETEENCRHIPTTGLHIVSERAKQFESGRPLSPDGQLIDRTSLYRSELSRLSTKRPVPNVAVRRREFEMKAENTDWRKLSSDDNDSSHNYDSSDYFRDHPGIRARSLSADSACDMSARGGDRSLVHSFNEDQFVNRDFSRTQPPYRQNSYIEAVTQTGAEHGEASVKEKLLFLQQQQGESLTPKIPNEIKFQNRSNQSGEIVYKINDNNKDIEMKQVVDIIRTGSSTLNGSSSHPTLPIRPTTLNLTESNQVVRRQKAEEDDDERPMRRVSYLRATANDTAFEIDSDMDQSPLSQLPDTPDNDAVHSLKSAHRPWRRPRFTTDIQPLRRIFEEAPPSVILPTICEPGKNLPSPTSHGSKSKALSYFRDAPADSNVPILKEGELNVKITFVDGKRSNDRSWKTVWAEIRGNKLKLTLHREGKSTQSPEPSGIIDLRSFHVTDANYTKRKYVFKLTSATHHSTNLPSSCGTEILIQTENQHEMKVWMDQLCEACGQNDEPVVIMRKDYIHSLGSQQAEPQRIAGTTIIESSDDITPPNKNSRRLSLGTRSPSGQSPVIKNRKTPNQPSTVIIPHSAFHQREEIGSPKSKTWSSVVRSIRRSIQGPVPIQTLPEGASIGAPLIHCPPSDENQYIPYLVARCINIVESRGLSVVGIYRIPGNTAAITALTELVNRGFDEPTLKDPKWEDVNVVSSLLKLFIRRLPDGLLPNEMYQHFIDADKQTGKVRLLEIKALLKKLPPHSYETLKILIKHLNRVSHNCDINLMEPRNIAIVFGPSIVRSATDTLETAVKDMKHQCRIVEALVLYYSFFFENDPVPQVTETPEPTHDKVPEGPHTDLLLNNVAKIEPLMNKAYRTRSHSVFTIPNPKLYQKPRRPSITTLDKESSFVANIVQAANRKIRQRAQRKSTTSATPDSVSLDSSTSAESKEHLKRFGSEESTSNSQSRNTGLGDSQKRLSEDDINDSAFADNGSMSLNTVTTLLDNKLRSLRNKSPPGNRRTTDNELDEHNNKPLSLGENIPYADESPERPIRSKPIRTYTNRSDLLPSQSSTPPNSPESSQENISKAIDGNEKIKSPSITSSSCDDTDVSSSSTAPPPPPTHHTSSSKQSTTTTAKILSSNGDVNEAVTASNQQPSSQSTSMRIDTEVLREMNQILSDLEKFKTKLNRSLSLNYKNHHKDEYCCCNSQNHHHHHHRNNNNHNINYNHNSLNSNNNTTSTSNNNNTGLSLRSQNNQNQNQQQQQNRLSLTKDEKTDKNISKKRQLQDVKYNRRYHSNGSRSIKRRHTVGGTHDYSNKIITCYASNGGTTTTTSSGSNNNTNGSGVENENEGKAIFRASSSELVALKKKELKSPQQEQENTCHY